MYMNSLILGLTVQLGNECSSWVQPATASPLLLPNLSSSTGSIRASMKNCSVWTCLLPGLVQVVFLTALVWSSSQKTKQKGTSHCPTVAGPHSPRNRETGDAVTLGMGCNMVVCLVQSPSEIQHGSRWPAGFRKPSSSACLHQER